MQAIGRMYGDFVGGRGAIGLLLVRLVFGLALMMHGWGKIQHPFNWMDRPGAPAPIPGFLQFLAALSEFGGGLALIVGLLTPLAALGIFFTMLFAVVMVHMKAGDPFVSGGGGKSYESAASYLVVALLMFFTGPGTLSLDHQLFGRKQRAR